MGSCSLTRAPEPLLRLSIGRVSARRETRIKGTGEDKVVKPPNQGGETDRLQLNEVIVTVAVR